MELLKTKFQQLNQYYDQNILTLELNNPEQMNALSDVLIEELCEALDHYNNVPEVRVLILTGKGKSFCAGGDIKAMNDKTGMFAGESEELRQRYLHGIQKIPRSMENFRKPIIAKINGAAIGAGVDLTCMCDLRVASKSAKFGETFCKLGLVPGDGGPYFLTRVLGYAKTMELYLTGDIISAEEAYRIGLLNYMVDDEQLDQKVLDLAQKIVKNAPVAITMTKQSIKAVRDQELSNHLEMMATYQAISQRTNDHVEGVKALLEKREPLFKGK